MDAAQGTLSVSGTPEQVKLAEWLAKEIDKPNGGHQSHQGNRAAPEYVAGNDDAVRILYFANAKSVPEFQELATCLRAIGETRLLFTLSSQNAIAVRGTREQVRLAEWLVNEFDKPQASANEAASPETAASPNPPAPEYKMSGTFDRSGTPDNLVRVFYLTRTPTVQEFQEVVTLVRSITECRRAFSINARKALVVRGTAEQIGLAEFLYNEMQAAKQPSSDAASAKHEYRIIPAPAFPGLDLVRVFQIAGIGTVQDFQAFVTTFRKTAEIRQVFAYNEPRVLVVRGSESQIALAKQLVDGRGKQSAQ